MEERKIFLIGGPANGQEVIMQGGGTKFMIAQSPPILSVLTRDTCEPDKSLVVCNITYEQSLEDPCIFIHS